MTAASPRCYAIRICRRQRESIMAFVTLSTGVVDVRTRDRAEKRMMRWGDLAGKMNCDPADGSDSLNALQQAADPEVNESWAFTVLLPGLSSRYSTEESHGQGHRIHHHVGRRLRHRSRGRPEYGLGRGGERLHYWVMGGPWTYEGGHEFAMHGPDKQFYDELVSTLASGVVGRGMYDAAGAWGGTNPFPGTLFVLTHRTADQPAPASGFRFVGDLDAAFAQAADAAGDGDVAVGGGADVIRQALAAGKVDEGHE